MCEQPLATSVAECVRMIAACKAANRKLMIGYRCHFEPFNLEAMRLARSGAAGNIRYVRSEHGFIQGDPSRWRLKRALSGGGSLRDMGVYSLPAARYMTGEEPVDVQALESTDRSDPRFHEVEDQIDWQLLFPSGVVAACNWCGVTCSSLWASTDRICAVCRPRCSRYEWGLVKRAYLRTTGRMRT